MGLRNPSDFGDPLYHLHIVSLKRRQYQRVALNVCVVPADFLFETNFVPNSYEEKKSGERNEQQLRYAHG